MSRYRRPTVGVRTVTVGVRTATVGTRTVGVGTRTVRMTGIGNGFGTGATRAFDGTTTTYEFFGMTTAGATLMEVVCGVFGGDGGFAGGGKVDCGC